jgi:hypothetical protein
MSWKEFSNTSTWGNYETFHFRLFRVVLGTPKNTDKLLILYY